MFYYVGTLKRGAKHYQVALDPHARGWAEDIADLLRTFGDYADVRVFASSPVDELIGAGRVTVIPPEPAVCMVDLR